MKKTLAAALVLMLLFLGCAKEEKTGSVVKKETSQIGGKEVQFYQTAEFDDMLRWVEENAKGKKVMSYWDRNNFILRASGVNAGWSRKDLATYFLGDGPLPEPKPEYVVVDYDLVFNLVDMIENTERASYFSDFGITPFHYLERGGDFIRFIGKTGVVDIAKKTIIDTNNGTEAEMLYSLFCKIGTNCEEESFLSVCTMIKEEEGMSVIYPQKDMGYKNLLPGCVFHDNSEDFIVWASDTAIGSNIFNLLFLDGNNNMTKTEKMEIVYYNGYSKVFKVGGKK